VISFLDTNVLVYRVDRNAAAKQRTAQALTDQLIRSGEALLSTQVLQELYAVLTRQFRPLVSAATAARLVDRFAQIAVVQVTPSIILASIAKHRRYSISFWDALIVQAAIAGGAQRIYSEDFQHGLEIEGVRIENPFLTATP
jgi:predicted nucleic acid-binding protein